MLLFILLLPQPHHSPSLFHFIISLCLQFDSRKQHEVIELLSLTEDKHCIEMGDFNFLDIDWIGPTAGPNGRDIVDGFQDYFLYKLVETPTSECNITDLFL